MIRFDGSGGMTALERIGYCEVISKGAHYSHGVGK